MSLDDVNVEIINDNKSIRQLVESGVLLDDEHTCFYGFHSLFEIVWSIINDSIIYNVTVGGKQIGIIMVSNFKELEDEVEIGMCIGKDYRGKGIGYYLLDLVIKDCFLNNAKAVHALVRSDNNASLKLCYKLNFKKYDDDNVEDFCYRNKKIKQNHFVIKKENQ